MEYYHLIVKDTNGNEEIKYDCTDIKWIKDKANKYKYGEDFMLNGKTFNKNKNIDTFKIVTTNDSAEMLAKLKTNDPNNDGIILDFDPEDIVKDKEYTKDITDEVLENL